MTGLIFKGVQVGDKLVGRGVPLASASALAQWLSALIADAHFVQVKLTSGSLSVWAESQRGTEHYSYTLNGNTKAFSGLGNVQQLGLIVGHTYVFSKAATVELPQGNYLH